MQPRYQKSASARFDVDELRNLSVASLMARKGHQAGRGLALERRIAGQRHADRADGRVAAKDRKVAALGGLGTRRCGQHAGRRQVTQQELDGAGGALVDQAVDGPGCSSCIDGLPLEAMDLARRGCARTRNAAGAAGPPRGARVDPSR